MFYIVYSVYIDSLAFLRKNMVVVLPFLMFSSSNLLLQYWKPDGQSLKPVIQICLLLFIPSLLETYAIVFVYRNMSIINPVESIWHAINKYYERTLLLSLLGGVIAIFISIPFIYFYLVVFKAVNSVRLGWFYVWLIVLGILSYVIALGVRFLILKDAKVITSYKNGFRELRSALFFYFLAYFLYVVLLTLPSLILIRNLSNWNGFNWLWLLLLSILSCWMSIATTYGFLHNQKKV